MKSSANIEPKEPQQISPQPPPPYAYYPYGNMEEDEIDLVQLFLTIKKYLWLIILIVLVSVTGTYFYAKSLPNLYKAQAVIFSPAKSTSSSYLSALSNLGVGSLLGGDATPVDIVVKLLNSRLMAKEVINNFNLVAYYEKQLSKQAFTIIDGISSDDSLVLWDYLKQNDYIDEKGYATDKLNFKNKNFQLELPEKYSTYKNKIIATLKLIANSREMEENHKPEKMQVSPEYKATFDLEKTIKIFKGNLSVEKDKASFITLSFEDRNPLLAAKLVNFCISNLDHINEQLEISSQKPLVVILDKADMPVFKSKPNKKMIMIISIVTSLIAGVFLSFVIEYLRNLNKTEVSR
ncbi:MAG: Wzz/FepE/Etk N-terminal domain-containing protein [Candidatus Margulisbacteria bacterium]|nr:Wzz/FepE/Etk N-terminal domain-containing protein [Candidatus Margulisiibacteriota bacterium]